MKLIDKTILIGEIKRLIDCCYKICAGNLDFLQKSYPEDYYSIETYKNILSFIDTLEVIDPYEQYVQYSSIKDGIKACDIKPYLRPLSSMTEDENDDLYEFGWRACWNCGSEIRLNEFAGFKETYRSLIWLVRNHFDCFNLINQGLAIKVTKNNNPYKQNEKVNCE